MGINPLNPTVDDTYLTDINHRKDYILTETGDLALDSGISNVKNALYHRLVTTPGTLIHRPDYGVGIKDFQNSINTLGTQRSLALRIKQQFERDPRVVEVLSISSDVNDLTPGLTKITVIVKLIGGNEGNFEFIPFGEGIVSG